MENKEFLLTLLTELKKPMPVHWRVQSFSKKKPIATVMAYIDARDAMDALDTYAFYGWHREHYVVDGKVYCKVGIVMPDGSIQWRSDCGVESNTDGEKGQSSDSFKRACVNFGVGRFLYDLPVEYITSSEVKSQSNYPYCIDDQGKQIWDLTTYINNKSKKPSSSTNQTRSNPELPKVVSDDLTGIDSRKKLVEVWNKYPLYHTNDKFTKAFNVKAEKFPKPQTA